MKKIFPLYMLLLLATTGYCQNAYYDALVLSRHLMGNDDLNRAHDSVFMILDQYIEPGRKNTPQQIVDSINLRPGRDPNPFLEISAGTQADHRVADLVRNGLNAVGGLQVSNLADGLAQFLIERSKDELSVAFFDKLKRDLKKYPELKVLFPTTSQFMENIEAYLYVTFLQTLREAFLNDLASLPAGLRNLRTLRPSDCPTGDAACSTRIAGIQNFFDANPASVLYVSATILMEKLQAGASIPTVLTAIANDPHVTKDPPPGKFPNSDYTNTLLLADIFSRSLQSRDADRLWITRGQLNRLRDTTVLRLFFGLVYQECKNKNITFQVGGASVVFTSRLTPGAVKKYFQYLEEIIGAAEQVNTLADEIREKKKSGEKFDVQDYVGYLNSAVDVVDAIADWTLLGTTIPKQEIERVLKITRASISVYYNIRSEQYASAISNTVIILDNTLGNNYDRRDEVLRYGSFMASIVQAKSAEEVKATIETIALPVGSASIKKSVPFNIALNAYLGGLWGEEYLAEKKAYRWKQSVGVAAPIGITISTRLCNWSVSAFGSLIDLGAVVSYRLKDDSTKSLPDLKLQNIFAPGYGLVIGIPKVPLSIGYMRQLGPALREITPGAAELSDKLNKRWYFFFAVDIPLVNFYTVPQRRK